MSEIDEHEYDDAAPEDALREPEGVDGGDSETPCFDALFARYDSGDGRFGTEHLGSLLLGMGFSCEPRVLDLALDDMDPNATGEIAKLTFLEWFEANADEIDVSSAAAGGSRGSPSRHETPRDEGDDSVEGGDGALTQATSAMLEAKNERKRAEADVQVISNRLMHLRADEARAQKRIDEANRRAKEIEAVKRRNAEHQRAKQRALEELQLEVKRTHDYNQLAVATARARKHQHMSAIGAMRSQLVKETRAERASHLQRIHHARDADQRQLAEKTKEIRSQEKSALQKREATRRQHEKELLRRTREQLASEHARKLRNDALIAQMEQEEAALIERVRVSHEMQRAAYEHLEFVIHDE